MFFVQQNKTDGICRSSVKHYTLKNSKISFKKIKLSNYKVTKSGHLLIGQTKNNFNIQSFIAHGV